MLHLHLTLTNQEQRRGLSRCRHSPPTRSVSRSAGWTLFILGILGLQLIRSTLKRESNGSLFNTSITGFRREGTQMVSALPVPSGAMVSGSQNHPTSRPDHPLLLLQLPLRPLDGRQTQRGQGLGSIPILRGLESVCVGQGAGGVEGYRQRSGQIRLFRLCEIKVLGTPMPVRCWKAGPRCCCPHFRAGGTEVLRCHSNSTANPRADGCSDLHETT